MSKFRLKKNTIIPIWTNLITRLVVFVQIIAPSKQMRYSQNVSLIGVYFNKIYFFISSNVFGYGFYFA